MLISGLSGLAARDHAGSPEIQRETVRRPVACRPMVHEHQPDDCGRVTLRPATSADESEFLGLARTCPLAQILWVSLPSTPEDFQSYIRRHW
jgi:hypothetical protein